jgi:Preprotein translocase subunit SecY
MLKFIETLKNIWTIDELKNRILITLFFLIIYRLAAQVVLPGVNII